MLKARYVVPVNGPVVEDGAVVIEGGRIAAVGPAARFSARETVDYGDAVICPGFVNAHTHLELSTLNGLVPPSHDFVDWLCRLMATVPAESMTFERVREAVCAGIAQSLAAGVTTVGDIARFPTWTREVLAASPLRCVSFGEVIAIGTRRNLLGERLDAASDTKWHGERMRVGVSPHSPYTVEPQAMRACAERARELNAPPCVHLAETAHEDAFTRSGEGPLADYLRTIGIWDASIPVSGCGPVELAARTGLLSSRTVIAHANYVSDRDINLIAQGGAHVAYCPRTHRVFGHPPHRFREMIAAGINVCIGTDSLASNPSLSILDELRFLRREYPDLSAEDLLAMGILCGAKALGFEAEMGTLNVGKTADLVVIPLDVPHHGQGWTSILESTQPPVAVYVSGLLHVSTGSRPQSTPANSSRAGTTPN
jgi:cytosine/adenosine deaminase-related metal-dependent hydrolase